MKDADKIKAATLLVHGNNDFNVMTKNAAQLWDVLKKNNVPRQFYFHQARPHEPAAERDGQPLVHEVPVGPGQRRPEPAEVVGRA